MLSGAQTPCPLPHGDIVGGCSLFDRKQSLHVTADNKVCGLFIED